MTISDTSPDRTPLIRGFLTIYTTLQALALILFFGMAPYFKMPIKSDESLGIVELVLPLFSGYVGLIVGFYFGTKEGGH